jgi:hypothetical protein
VLSVLGDGGIKPCGLWWKLHIHLAIAVIDLVASAREEQSRVEEGPSILEKDVETSRTEK